MPSPARRPSPQGGDFDEAADGSGDDEEDEVPAEETRGYWRTRVEEIASASADLQAQFVDHRREERVFLFSHRSTAADTRRKMEVAQQRLVELDDQMRELRRDARRQGIPPGWLRGS